MLTSRTRRGRMFGFGMTVCLAASGTAAAQTPARRPAAPQQATAGGQWEVEVRGGFAASRIPTDGSAVLPLPGPVLTTTSPLFPTREAPSWFFGDGAAQLNGAIAEFDLAPRLQALDAALGRAGVSGSGRAVVGFTARRAITQRYSVEFGLDILAGSSGLADGFADAAAASAASFESAFTGLLVTGPLSGIDVTAASAVEDGSGRELALTGAIEWRFAPRGALVPYLTFGGGVVTGVGDRPSVTIEGRYRFRILDQVPIDETDRVVIRFERAATPVAIVGGGVRKELSNRWALRIDARALLGSSGARTLIDAAPSSVTGSPAGFVETFTNPGLQFSNNTATGRLSTLSGPGLEGFEAFKGQGLQTRLLVTVGLVRRF